MFCFGILKVKTLCSPGFVILRRETWVLSTKTLSRFIDSWWAFWVRDTLPCLLWIMYLPHVAMIWVKTTVSHPHSLTEEYDRILWVSHHLKASPNLMITPSVSVEVKNNRQTRDFPRRPLSFLYHSPPLNQQHHQAFSCSLGHSMVTNCLQLIPSAKNGLFPACSDFPPPRSRSGIWTSYIT